ncbi:tellurite resistance TerB family protein [Streptomyces sp. ID03-2B]|uniref:tellurite resistance TerB family protein n=1 Tax=Streptomyces TaxID=1883 RepID=UPI0004C70FC9|nr:MULTISPECIES: tellurite resistance TerB family protein [Streptomyces]MDX3342491.1 tellurite resistance TerB family protein [Streptomyces sp. ME02-6979.5a]MDX3589569.1 tellurite resistance TerB family protein [Streptomyces sp. ID03-2B]
MAMWDRIKDQAKGLQQQSQGARGPAAGGRQSGTGASGSSKEKLVGLLKSQLGSLKTELKSGAYRDASMAMCALVAAADGSVDPAERHHVESLIVQNDVLQNFPPEQLRQRFNKHVDQMTVNFPQGKAEAMQEIAKAAKKPVEAKAVVQTGFVIAGADGYIAPAEAQVLREACAALGVSPQEFGL